MTIQSDSQLFKIGDNALWAGRTLYELYEEAHIPWEWHFELRETARNEGLVFFSTPFDATAVDFLESMEVPVYKIASFELVDLPLIRKVAATGKPIILSTGMATLGEIEEAVNTARDAGATEIALLKTNSAYPAPVEEMNLATIPHLAKVFGLPVGLSDHTLDPAVPAVAVALGASIIEKHLTLSRGLGGPDSGFSLEPDEFEAMVKSVRVAEKALGRVKYGPMPSEENSQLFRRSLFAVADISAGEQLSEDNIRSIRPGNGLHTRYMDQILGCRAVIDISKGTPLNWGMFT